MLGVVKLTMVTAAASIILGVFATNNAGEAFMLDDQKFKNDFGRQMGTIQLDMKRQCSFGILASHHH